MKIYAFLAAVLLAGAATTGVVQADEKTASSKAVEAQTEKTVKPSNTQEKTATPQSAPEAKADKLNAAKDKNKHFHPRDGK